MTRPATTYGFETEKRRRHWGEKGTGRRTIKYEPMEKGSEHF